MIMRGYPSLHLDINSSKGKALLLLFCISQPQSSLAASDKVYQLLARGRWFSLGTPASSTTTTGRHDIAEILLKVMLKHQFFFLLSCMHQITSKR
jgi:hypothetical protein